MALQQDFDFKSITVTNGYIKVVQAGVGNRNRDGRGIRCQVAYFANADDATNPGNAIKHKNHQFDFVSPDSNDDLLQTCYMELKKLDEFAEAADV